MKILQHVRILDVLLLGPLQILVGLHIQQPFLHTFMVTTGLTNILYNGHNYALLERQWLKSTLIPGVRPFGKTQIHRVWNCLVMYPIFWKASNEPEVPNTLRVLLQFETILGFMFNAYYLYKYMGISTNTSFR